MSEFKLQNQLCIMLATASLLGAIVTLGAQLSLADGDAPAAIAQCVYEQMRDRYAHANDADIRRLAVEGQRPELTEVLNLYQQLTGEDPALKALLPESEIYPLLADETMTYYPSILLQALRKMTAPAPVPIPAPVPVLGRVEQFRHALSEVLAGKVPAATIHARIAGLETHTPAAYRRAFGDMTLEEVQLLVHGGDPLHPTPDSLLGKFLAESGTQTVARSFRVGVPLPGQDAARIPLGPQRLVVGLDAANFPIFEKYFNRPELSWFFGHAQVSQGGKIFSYSKNGEAFGLPPSINEVLPVVLTKTTESQREAEYFQFMVKAKATPNWDFNNLATYPWRIPGYCTAGAWEACPQWIANMPIGDQLVDRYTFPGMRPEERHAQAVNRLPRPEGMSDADYNAFNAAPRVTPLNDYDVNNPAIQALWPRRHGPMSDYDKRLLRRVWGTSLGHQQFAYAVGLGTQSERQQFVNPGWVIVTLLGKTSVDRSPVVFVRVNDHTQPISPDFQPYYENPE
jgi:hypothetical protein